MARYQLGVDEDGVVHAKHPVALCGRSVQAKPPGRMADVRCDACRAVMPPSPGAARGRTTDAKADTGFGADALAATSGLRVALPGPPTLHGLRLLETLDVDWYVDADAAPTKTCPCTPWTPRGRRA